MFSEERLKRIYELKNRSYERGIFTFTDFLNPTAVAEVCDLFNRSQITAYGGADFCERQIVRFGNVDELGYDEPFPIAVLKVTLEGGKFAEKVTHRDVLGAVLNLGIERQKLGDIFVNGNFIYIIADEKVAKLISSDLRSVGRNKVSVEEIDSLPLTLAPTLTEKQFSVPSNRADAVICKVYNLSREDGAELFKKGFVTVLGKVCDKSSKELKEGDVVAVRGYGKFNFLGVFGNSKKGKPYVSVEIYN